MSRGSLRSSTWLVAGAAAIVAACAPVLLADAPGVSAGVTPGVKPDIVLSSSNRTFDKEVTSILVNDLTPQADPAAVPTADQCRDLPALDLYCDVYRVKVVRDRSPGASNFVQVLMTWDRQASTPSLALVAAGLSDSDAPDLELFLYEDAATYADYHLVGGRSAVTPERLVFEATQDEYDIVVRSGLGVGTGYSLNARYSNELFEPPFELLEDVSSGAVPPPGSIKDGSAEPEPAQGGVALQPQLGLAPIAVDGDIAGIGLGTTEQFDPERLGRAAQNLRNVAATSKPPSALMLITAMLALPLAAAWFAFFVLRRRRDVFAA